MRDIVYLACPHTDDNPEVRRKRFELATAAAATLVKQGIVVYSPITMGHPINEMLADLKLSSDFWVDFDEAFMDKCAKLIVLQIDGWDRSSGVKREMDYFANAGKGIFYMLESDIR